MFCKLFKYDMKELWKKVWLMYFFLLITAMIARGTNLLGKQVSFFSYISTGASILLIIASMQSGHLSQEFAIFIKKC